MIEMFKKALKTPNLKIVYGTDAVAGAHGRNIEEAVVRVRDGGQKPMDAIVSLTSRSAEAMQMQKTIGRSRRACRRTSSRWKGIRWPTSRRCARSCS